MSSKIYNKYLKILMYLLINYFYTIYNDAPEPWQLGFQDTASPNFTGLVTLHNTIGFYLIVISFGVFWVLFSAIFYYNSRRNSISHKYLTHGTVLELIWTITPALILIAIAFPSFTLLYLMDEVISPTLTIKVIGHQWYWCAPFNYLYRSNLNGTHDVATRGKRTDLSNVEKLGECSMSVTEIWVIFTLNKKYFLLKFYKVFVSTSYWANTALALMGKILCYLIIIIKDQLLIMATIRNSLQQGGQDVIPKLNYSGRVRNWGLSTECKLYDLPKGNHRAGKDNIRLTWIPLLARDNGASVLWSCITKSKGMQPTNVLPLSTGRFYSSKVRKTSKPEEIKALECSYKQLFDIEIYKSAYQLLRSKLGNMTPSADQETLDNFSFAWAEEVVLKMKERSFQFKPSVKMFIPKKDGRQRPLSIPTSKDIIIQQSIRMIFESVYEPLFLDTSHGFRPKRSTHTAIFEVRKWNGITWMIEGDIKGYFDNINPHILAELLKKQIKDPNLIDLYWKLVNAGYVNDGNYEKNNLGVPQGGVISPLLSNIYLHEFDTFMQELCKNHSNLSRRVSTHNPAYESLRKKVKRLKDYEDIFSPSDKLLLNKLIFRMRNMSSVIRDSNTPNRVYYNRYADDWIVGITGDLKFAESIKHQIEAYLKNTLNLTVNDTKTKITHMITNKVSYLGFLISRHHRKYNKSLIVKDSLGRIRRGNTVSILVEAPIEKIINKLIEHGFAWNKCKPKAVTKWIYLKPEEILVRYNAVIRGLLNYYKPVENRNQFSYVMWIFKFSAVFTLARKFKISPKAVWKIFGNPTTVKFTRNGKEKSLSLYNPSNLRKDKSFNLRKDKSFNLNNYFNFDPFSVKYFDVRSHHI